MHSITINCPHCGGNHFGFPERGDDDSEVTCQDCDRVVGTLGDLKNEVAQRVIGSSAADAGLPQSA